MTNGSLNPEWYTVTRAAAALGISVRAVRKRIAAGLMQASRVGPRAWIIHHSEVERWRALGRQRPGPKPKPRKEGEPR